MPGVETTVMLEHSGLEARVVRCRVQEGLSEIYQVDLQFAANQEEPDLAELLWTSACVRIVEDGELLRSFHGIIELVESLPAQDLEHHYGLRLRPRMHSLAYRVRTRIFQEVSVVDIVKQVFEDAGVDDVEWDLQADYVPREYCTQYKESELAFVRRLLADEGIFFWFSHDEVGHTLHLADAASSFEPADPDQLHVAAAYQSERGFVTDLRFDTKLVRDAYVARDWDWMSPATPVQAQQARPDSFGFEHYEYPAGFIDPSVGGRYATDRLDAESVDKYVLRGKTPHRGLAPGRIVGVAEARPDFLNRDYLLLSLVHDFVATPHAPDVSSRSGATEARFQWSWTTRFKATFDDTSYRPPRAIKKPRIFGIESAVVTSDGEEIHVDEWGRIKVHFHWDRENPVDDKASCWLRVQQQNTSGSMFLPRIGWEMAVAFLDGDPDRPVALQKLYNQETMPPYPQPASLNQAALQSATSPGGGGMNELRLDDSNGAQGFFINAQHDFMCTSGHDGNEKVSVDAEEVYESTLDTMVGVDESVSIGANLSVTVQGNAKLETGGNQTVKIGAVDDWGVKGNFTCAAAGSRDETIGAAQNVMTKESVETISGSQTKNVGAALAYTAAKAVAESVAADKMETIGGARIITVTGDYEETIGSAKALKSGASKIEAGGSFSISAQGAIGVTVKGAWAEKVSGAYSFSGKKVKVSAKNGAKIQGGGTKFNLKSGKLTLDGSKFGAKGGPMLKLKGKIDFKL